MADISAWSPVDESNTSAPPNGWPENMQPSAVNNSARAVMGGVRRWYDTVTAQLASISANFSNYLPLSGGTLSGALTGTTIQGSQLTSTGNINALGIVNATLDVSANRNLIAAVNCTVGGNLNVGGTTTLSGVTAAAISASTNITASGTISASAYDCDGVRVIDTSGSNVLLYKPGNIFGIQLQGTATYYDNNTHAFRNFGGSNTFTIDSAGNVDAAAQVQGATIYSRGGITAAGNISATGTISAGSTISSSGNLYAGGSVDGIYVVSRGDMTCTSTFNALNGLSNINAIQPRADHDGFVGRAGLSFDSMSCYNYITVSDAGLKRDIEMPTGCLDMVRAIPARTYRWADGPDIEKRHWGLIAQEAGDAGFSGRLIDPETGQQGLALNELVALLWGAVRELSDKLEEAHSTRERG